MIFKLLKLKQAPIHANFNVLHWYEKVSRLQGTLSADGYKVVQHQIMHFVEKNEFPSNIICQLSIIHGIMKIALLFSRSVFPQTYNKLWIRNKAENNIQAMHLASRWSRKNFNCAILTYKLSKLYHRLFLLYMFRDMSRTIRY